MLVQLARIPTRVTGFSRYHVCDLLPGESLERYRAYEAIMRGSIIAGSIAVTSNHIILRVEMRGRVITDDYTNDDIVTKCDICNCVFLKI